MSRYLSRLPRDARVHFQAKTGGGGENALIGAAMSVRRMGPAAKLDHLCRFFGESNVPQAEAVLDKIYHDLVAQGEASPVPAAGEPVDEEAVTNNFRFVFAQIDGASPEQVEMFAKMIGGILADRR